VAVEKLTVEKSAEKRSRQDDLQTTFSARLDISYPQTFPMISEILSFSTTTPVKNSQRTAGRTRFLLVRGVQSQPARVGGSSKMRLSAILAFYCVPTLILGFALPGWAGQHRYSCIKAASSRNGGFLVLMNMQLDAPQNNDPGPARRIRQVSFEMFPKVDFTNAKDKLTAPGEYFSDGSWVQWGVQLDLRNSRDWPFASSCALPLVTDDGEFLVLLAQSPALSADMAVLRIYRRDRTNKKIPSDGQIISEIPLKTFHIPLEPNCCDDETPEWFAGGSFDFSSDDRQLIYKSQYGNSVRITLDDGSVSRK
jgi:hypothetical protein